MQLAVILFIQTLALYEFTYLLYQKDTSMHAQHHDHMEARLENQNHVSETYFGCFYCLNEACLV